ncbi:hypothetical protein LJC08_02075 [Methanimicrococcus sp. OttesenSCG-928-J09]|nr:hypothetical protein [Methanimicrococcus sp. OttesenSCG-928-J09]
MKHLLVALLVLLALVGTAVAADNTAKVSTVEIRSAIIHYGDATSKTINYATFAAAAPGDAWLIDASTWAGLYYDLDNNQKTEKIAIKTNGTGVDIKYQTAPAFKDYDYNWTYAEGVNTFVNGYAIIGFFAEPYVAIGKKDLARQVGAAIPDPVPGVKANKIAKLILDTDEKYTLKTGATLEMGEGYSLIVDQIDVDGNKAYIKLMKDGKELNSSIVTTSGNVGGDWIFELNVLNENNSQVMRVHVKDVFQGTQDSLVEIEGLWLIDYLNAFEVKSDVDYGKFEEAGVGTDKLTYEATGISLSSDLSTDLGRGIYLKTEKEFSAAGHVPGADKDKFYLFKEYTEPGVYEVRSSVVNYDAGLDGAGLLTGKFTYENFAAFYYDIDANVFTETMTIKSAADGLVKDKELTYTTKPEQVGYDYDSNNWNGQKYFVMGLFGEKYVPLNKVDADGKNAAMNKAEKMAKLIMDNDDKYTLKTGATLELGEGYSVIVDQIDVDGNKAYVKLMKDGKEINSSIVTTSGNVGGDWIFRLNVLNENNTQVLRLHVKDVFQGTESSLVEFEGIWLMDYQNAKELKTDDKYGLLEFKSGGTQLDFESDGSFTIQADMDKQIANNMYLKAADNTDALGKNMYFYVAMEIEGDGSQPPVDPTPTEPTPEPTPTEPTPTEPTPTEPEPTPEPPESFWSKYMWYIIGAIVLIIIIAGAAYYFMVYKKQA